MKPASRVSLIVIFAIAYLYFVFLFAGIAKIVAHRKGWDKTSEWHPAPMMRGADFLFLGLWFGPVIFLVAWALPPRWSIPREVIEEELETLRKKRKDRLDAKVNQSGITRWLHNKTNSLIEASAYSFATILFVIAPFLQIALVLHIGFGFFDSLQERIVDWLNNAALASRRN